MKMKKYLKKQSLLLTVYDLFIACFSCFVIFYLYLHKTGDLIAPDTILIKSLIFIITVFGIRYLFKLYSQVWRYAEVNCYLKLMVSDFLAMGLYYVMDRIVLQSIFDIKRLSFGNTVSLFSINLLITLATRIVYRYCFKYGNNVTGLGKLSNKILQIFSFGRVKTLNNSVAIKIPVAILGAGRIGTSLAQEFNNNANSIYTPAMFLESDLNKIGKEIDNIHIYDENISKKQFEKYRIEEVIFTVPNMDINKRQELYKRYKDYGLRIKVYDNPVVESSKKKNKIRDFDIEDLLFRKTINVIDEKTTNYYKNKVVLITGGGGSIGSEMARQIAKMNPKQLILVDIYENGVYDVQTELRLIYKNELKLAVEISNVCDRKAMEKIFSMYKPNIVIHAAAHKHVPLMEHNCAESINNNVFGTLVTVETSEKFNVERFILVSTDKAVNPTNVMGATKRMCEMIVKAHSEKKNIKTTFSMTRFGNVLNSAGSVIPLFEKQISNGGPVTITDKRIIRYFMTIPEASQLVLKSGAMAKNGELFVLDMGKPVKILELAENMIKLSGLRPYEDIEIEETGLRPGEKLYEELLINNKNLTKTKDDLIFIEDDKPLTMKKLNENISLLQKACDSKDDEKARKALRKTVPTYKKPEEINNI